MAGAPALGQVCLPVRSSWLSNHYLSEAQAVRPLLQEAKVAYEAANAACCEVCLPVPSWLSNHYLSEVQKEAKVAYEAADAACCEPYDDSSASDTCRNETIEMVQNGSSCTVRAECHVPVGLHGFTYVHQAYHKSTSITVSTGDVDDLHNCSGDLTNGSC